MTNKKHPPNTKPERQPGQVRLGRESLSKVFRSAGGSELSSHHNARQGPAGSDPASGPRLLKEITDGIGPKQSLDIPTPLSGPTLHTELSDAAGTTDLREMRDSTGPIVPRERLEDYDYVPGEPKLSSSPLSNNTRETAKHETPAQATTIRLDTYSIQMEERLASVKASQKETLEKMKQLQTDEQPATDSATATLSSTNDAQAATMAHTLLDRHLLPVSALHPAIRTTVASHHRDIVDEVIQAIEKHKVVVIGMGGNPFVSRARKLLNQQAIDHHYLGYGNYVSGWRRRNALKMWTGWPTFPMIFISGVLIGGYQELQRLMRADTP